jgi:hypothetical protein
VFISGHSLTDNPMSDDMAAIAQSLSTPMWWNQQIVLGSPSRVRTRGTVLSDPTFSGYRTGKNRSSSNMNVVSELLNPQTIGGERYDTLLLTERHDLVDTLTWEDTVRYTRHFHDRAVAGNSRANTYLYHSWLSLSDKSNPGAWIAFERAAAPAWQCVASRVNLSLASQGRSDRVSYLPAGLALAGLVEQATRGAVAGVSAATVRETVDRIVQDDVHLTRLGIYYISLVNYASIYRRSPLGAWAPSEVNATQARALQEHAWNAVANHYNSATAPSMDQCQAYMRDQFCAVNHNFRNTANNTTGCVNFFSRQSSDNPFYFNPANDASYWFPAP